MPGAVDQNSPQISIGGSVVDTNGNPLNAVTVSCQGEQTTTNTSGQWRIDKLRVTNVDGLISNTDNDNNAVRCVVEAPAGYLGAIVSVYPEAQMDSQYAANGNNSDDTTYVPIVTFIDGMYVPRSWAVSSIVTPKKELSAPPSSLTCLALTIIALYPRPAVPVSMAVQ
jgi:hypothetical protein